MQQVSEKKTKFIERLAIHKETLMLMFLGKLEKILRI